MARSVNDPLASGVPMLLALTGLVIITHVNSNGGHPLALSNHYHMAIISLLSGEADSQHA